MNEKEKISKEEKYMYEYYLEEVKKNYRKIVYEIVVKAQKMKCPNCEKWFPKLTNEQYKDPALKDAIVGTHPAPWGTIGVLKNESYIECPHCTTKIEQG
ncbi:MAG: hypothetical protein MUO82_11715 [Candidatus Thermoplasmatota archaeon]|nr:hypothetical protein [Candidatus Thermoplasmatota archaeon]